MQPAMHDTAAAATAIEAVYFDGKTSRCHHVTLSADRRNACLAGDVCGTWPLAALRVSERVSNGVRRVTFPDGAYLETRDLAALASLLGATGFRDGAVVRMQQSWRGPILALLLTVAVLAAGYQYAIPAAARMIAFTLPAGVTLQIGQGTLALLDRHFLSASMLSPARRNRIVSRFEAIAARLPDVPAHAIVFRKSRIGPNAFALPSGTIVVTDEIIALAGSDDAVMGVLGHELGHLRQRHLLRRLIQGSATAALGSLLFGDVSSIAAGLPTLLLDLAYSRDAERQADDEAIALLKSAGIALEPFAHLFERLEARAAAEGGAGNSYLSSHPASGERVARIRAGR